MMGKWTGSSQETWPELLISGKLTPEPSPGLQSPDVQCLNVTPASHAPICTYFCEIKLYLSISIEFGSPALFSERVGGGMSYSNRARGQSTAPPSSVYPPDIPCPKQEQETLLAPPNHEINDPKSPILDFHSVQSLAPVQTRALSPPGSWQLAPHSSTHFLMKCGGTLGGRWHPR